MRVTAAILIALACAAGRASAEDAAPKLDLRSGDRVALVGATFIERDRHYGEFESVLRSRFPGVRFSVRNMAWPGDTTTVQLRPLNFGTFEENIRKQNPTVAIVSYGQNEAFSGPDQLESFLAGYESMLDVLTSLGARIVIVSPPPHEERSSPAANASAHNVNLEQYVAAIGELAAKRNLPFVDLFGPLREEMADPDAPALTENGIHLSPYGYWRAAQLLAAQLGLPEPSSSATIAADMQQITPHGCEVSDATFSDKQIAFNLRQSALAIPPPDGAPQATAAHTLQVTGLKPGGYTLSIDGQRVASASAEEWGRGVPITSGPGVDQGRELVEETQWKNLLFFNRWRAHNGEYIYGRRAATSEGWSPDKDGGNAGNPTFPSEMAEFERLMDLSERTASGLSIPAMHRYKLTAE